MIILALFVTFVIIRWPVRVFSFWSFIEKANFPFSKSLSYNHDPRREWIYPLPSLFFHQFPSNFVYQRRARSELYLSRTGYRVFDCRESRCPPRSPLSPALYHFTAISGIILRPWTTTASSRGTGRGKEREKFDGIGSCLKKQRAWPRQREKERGRSLHDLSSLVISLWVIAKNLPGHQVLVLSSCAIDSTRFDFSFQVADKSLQRVFLDARKRTIDDIIDNKRRLRARKMRAWNCFICKDNFMLARVNVH